MFDLPVPDVHMQTGLVTALDRAVRGSEAHAIQKMMRDQFLAALGFTVVKELCLVYC